MESQLIVFNGTNFRRYPESKYRSDRVYFTPGAGDKAKGIGRLHEEIWKAEHGQIPEGHHIHHVDHNPLNNYGANLTAMTKAAHHSHHANTPEARERLRSDEWLAHLAAIRPQAAAWHSSPAGVEWHREHARQMMAKRPKTPGLCDQCCEAFLSKRPLRFCSNACKSAWRRISGLDDIEGTCTLCGASFTHNRYQTKVTCTRSCSSKLARATDKARKAT